MQPQYNDLCTLQPYKILAKSQGADKLIIRIQALNNRRIKKIFEGEILTVIENLSKCGVESIEEFKEYLAEPGHIQFKQQNSILAVCAEISFKSKKNSVQLFKVPMNKIQGSNQSMKDLLERYEKPQQLSNNQIKNIFICLIQRVQQTSNKNTTKHNSIENLNDVYDTLVNKITVFGSRYQGIQSKFDTMKEKIINLTNFIKAQLQKKINNYPQQQKLRSTKSQLTDTFTILLQNHLQNNNRNNIAIQPFKNYDDKISLIKSQMLNAYQDLDQIKKK